MAWTNVIWDPTPGGNVEHVEEHGLEPEEVDHVIAHYDSQGYSTSSGRPCLFGHTPDGRYIIVVYEEIDEDTIMPWTAYEVTDREVYHGSQQTETEPHQLGNVQGTTRPG